MNSVSDQLLQTLDEASPNVRYLKLWALCVGGTLLAGYSMFALGVCVPLLKFSPTEIGMIGSALMLGGVLGSAMGGRAADRYGRRTVMLVDMTFVIAGGILSALSTGAPSLFLGQFLVGTGIGIDFPVSSAMVSETMPKRARSRMMVATIACQPIGMLMAAMLSLIFLKEDGLTGARYLLATEAVLGAIFAAGRGLLPESPRWLLIQGKTQQAVTEVLRLIPEERDLVEIEGKHLTPIPSITQPSIKSLLSKAYRPRTLLISVPWFLMDIATYGVGLFTPAILMAMNFAPAGGSPVAHDYADARGSALVDLFLLAGSLMSLWIVPKLGRVPMQKVGFIGMALGMVILLLGSGTPSILFLGFVTFNLLMNMGPNATTFALAPEFFPTELRATAGGFASSVAKLGAALGVFLLPILKEEYGISAVLTMVLIASLGGLFFTWLFDSEVLEQESLEAYHRAS